MVLAWHVDYWDYLGWKDPFGSKAHTARQKRLLEAKKIRQMQTPHLLVNNTPPASGKHKEALADAAQRKARVRVDGTATLVAKKIKVAAKLTRIDETLEFAQGFGVVPVLYRKTATTTCAAGENKGATLVEYFVVLATRDALKPGGDLNAEFDLPAGLAAGDLGVALLAEDGLAMETLDCVALPVSAGP